MSRVSVVRRAALGALLALSALTISACTYEQEGPPQLHFQFFETGAPKGNTVTVCSAYGCQHQTLFTFTDGDIQQLASIMEREGSDASPAAERKAIGQAIAWIERRVGPATGTDRDRPGLDFFGSGDKRQQDCVDEATNTTSYLLVMERNGMLTHHKVSRPIAKGNMILGRWPHWGAMIEERATGKRFAVDSFFYENGKPPVIMASSRWYIDKGDPATPARAPTSYAGTPDPHAKEMDRRGLARLLDTVIPPSSGPRPAAFGYSGEATR